MASWETETTASTHNVADGLNNQMQGRSRDTGMSIFSSMGLQTGGYGASEGLGGSFDPFDLNPFDGNFLGFGSTIKGYDLVGIAGGQVENMRDSIREYVSQVQQYAGKAIENAQNGMNDAFRGADAQAAVKAYLEKVRAYVNNLISQLLSFSDKLADVGNAWNTAQANIGGSVNASAGAFSEGTAYVDNITYNGGSN